MPVAHYRHTHNFTENHNKMSTLLNRESLVPQTPYQQERCREKSTLISLVAEEQTAIYATINNSHDQQMKNEAWQRVFARLQENNVSFALKESSSWQNIRDNQWSNYCRKAMQSQAENTALGFGDEHLDEFDRAVLKIHRKRLSSSEPKEETIGNKEASFVLPAEIIQSKPIISPRISIYKHSTNKSTSRGTLTRFQQVKKREKMLLISLVAKERAELFNKDIWSSGQRRKNDAWKRIFARLKALKVSFACKQSSSWTSVRDNKWSSYCRKAQRVRDEIETMDTGVELGEVHKSVLALLECKNDVAASPLPLVDDLPLDSIADTEECVAASTGHTIDSETPLFDVYGASTVSHMAATRTNLPPFKIVDTPDIRYDPSTSSSARPPRPILPRLTTHTAPSGGFQRRIDTSSITNNPCINPVSISGSNLPPGHSQFSEYRQRLELYHLERSVYLQDLSIMEKEQSMGRPISVLPKVPDYKCAPTMTSFSGEKRNNLGEIVVKQESMGRNGFESDLSSK